MTITTIKRIEKDELFLEFLTNRQLRPASIRNYKRAIASYLEVTGLETPFKMIKEAEEDEDERLRMRKRRIKKHLLKYYEWLKNEVKYSPNNIRNSMAAVRTFYNEFEIELPKIKISLKDIPEEEKDIPTTAELKTAIEYSNEKYKAIILLMASSGIPSAELRNLKVSDFLKSINKQPPSDFKNERFDIDQIGKINPSMIGKWDILRVKTGKNYCAFSSPESIEYILRYLKNNPPKSIDDYLFPNRYGVKMGNKSLSNYFSSINKKCGFPILSNGFTYLHPHSLRKFFSTTLVKNGLSETYTRWLLGHSLKSKTAASYIKPTLEGLKREYLRILPYLSIMAKIETKIITDERLQEMEEEIKLSESKVERLEVMVQSLLEKQL